MQTPYSFLNLVNKRSQLQQYIAQRKRFQIPVRALIIELNWVKLQIALHVEATVNSQLLEVA